MRQIAETAGVSRSAVSCVLNNYANPRVSAEKRDEIIRVAREMGYHRNEVATAIKKGRSKVIAFAGALTGEHNLEIAVGLSQSLQERGYSLKLLALDPSREAIPAVADMCGRCLEQMVAGVIFSNINQRQTEYIHEYFKKYKTPLLQVCFNSDHRSITKVEVDIEDAAMTAVKCFVSLGRKRIGFVNYNDRQMIFQRHAAAYKKALRANMLEFNPELLKGLSYPAVFDAGSPLCLWLKDAAPDAVFCVTEDLSFQILRAASRCGVSVPGALSVIGYGLSGHMEWSCPPLTALEAPYRQIGLSAAEIMVGMVSEGRKPDAVYSARVKLKIRESTSAIKNI
jgi:LacI family transcriptional regulator